MLNRLLVVMALALGLLSIPTAASAVRRIALVIGNAEYVHAKALRNPRNDAEDMAETLKKVGFEVLLGLDLDQQNFARIVEQYARRLEDADVGLFYFAGHGLQINEKNYLVSTQAKLESEFLVSAETIELESIVRLMESKTAVNLIFLDACRNNPLSENLRRNLAAMKRNVVMGRGLARIEPTGRDTLVAYAAAPGQEAADGRDRNSPFTQALLKHLPTPGLEVSVMLKEVAADVRRETQNSQRPQQLSDMSRTFYFTKAEAVVAARVEPVPQPQPSVAVSPLPVPAPAPGLEDRALDVAFWNAAQAANQCEAVRAYLQRFPNGNFVELGKLAERRLCVPGRRIDVAAPPTVPSLPANPAASAPQPAFFLPPPPGATAGPGAGSVVAALPSAPVEVPKSAPTKAELARGIQLELIRLGCGTMSADGIWTTSTKASIRLFNRRARASLDADSPSAATVAALRAREDRICAVATDIKQKPRKAERAPERGASHRGIDTQPRPARSPQASAAPVARAPAAPAAPYKCMMDEGQGRMRPCDAGR